MDDLNIVIAGAAGEGVQSVGDVLARAILAQGFAVFSWKEYESRVRGGQNSYSVRIGAEPRNAPLMKADILLALNEGALGKYRHLVKEQGIILTEKESRERCFSIPFTEIAKEELGKRIYANAVAVGALAGALGMELDVFEQVLEDRFGAKGREVSEANQKGARIGYERTRESCEERWSWEQPRKQRQYRLLGGNDALALGAVRAGCRFISAYPMTPSTGIITLLARNQQLEVLAEQAEDEIAAVNMAIGASYAGARAMTATSGGGFALMVEGVSLAGMTETPLVVVLAQRPGPATGLATRTAQGDMLFAVHAGHGEFPKIVLAPADAKDAFCKIVRAFNLADRFQTPVILLTDQFLADAHFSIGDLEMGKNSPSFHLADPAKIDRYGRYKLTKEGVSPRLYPGQSEHLVCADSHVHEESGHISENLQDVAVPMVEKRLAKLREIKKEMMPPEELRLKDAQWILVGWGSSREAMAESLDLLAQDGLKAGMIHFTELWPLPDYTFPEGKRLCTVESNGSGQLARLLRSEYGIDFQGSVRRYDGLPLTAHYIRRHFHD